MPLFNLGDVFKGFEEQAGIKAPKFKDIGLKPATEFFREAGEIREAQEAEAAPAAAPPFEFPEFVETPPLDIGAIREASMAQARRGAETARARGRGVLGRLGLTGAGAERAIETQVESELGGTATDLEAKLQLAQADFNSLVDQRKNAFNVARANFERGNFQFAQEMLLKAEAIDAELQGRQQPGFFGNLAGGLGTAIGTAVGGPVGGAVGGAAGGFLSRLFPSAAPARSFGVPVTNPLGPERP